MNASDESDEDDPVLRDLEAQYTRVTAEYASAMASYIHLMESSSAASAAGEKTEFTRVPGHTWWGETGLTSVADVASAADCETWCAADATCSGATYVASRNYCWLRKGPGALEPSDRVTDVAIVRASIAALTRIEAINRALADLNAQIKARLATHRAARDDQRDAIEHKRAEMEAAWRQLSEHQTAVVRQRADLQTLSEAAQEDTEAAARGFSTFVFWLGVLVVLLGVLAAGGGLADVFAVVAGTTLVLFLIACVS
jgi:hypothetical protein